MCGLAPAPHGAGVGFRVRRDPVCCYSDAAMRSACHLISDDSVQPTALAESLIGLGNLPSLISCSIWVRLMPTNSCRSRFLMIRSRRGAGLTLSMEIDSNSEARNGRASRGTYPATRKNPEATAIRGVRLEFNSEISRLAVGCD